eukprot:UN01667
MGYGDILFNREWRQRFDYLQYTTQLLDKKHFKKNELVDEFIGSQLSNNFHHPYLLPTVVNLIT